MLRYTVPQGSNQATQGRATGPQAQGLNFPMRYGVLGFWNRINIRVRPPNKTIKLRLLDLDVYAAGPVGIMQRGERAQ